VRAKTASRIMTGAHIPAGADAVVMLEKIAHLQEREGNIFLSIPSEIPTGNHMIPMGSEIKKGTLLLPKGEKINPGSIAILAMLGRSMVEVYQQPKVAILTTGSELLDIESPLTPGKIRNSNHYLLWSQILRSGAHPLLQATLPDHVAPCQSAILAAFTEVDLVITTGGVSVGDYDILVDIFQQWDGQLLFHKVAMKPGSPTTVGVWKDKFLFSLSGNPAACFVGFELFIRPVLWGMQGKTQIDLPFFTAVLAEDFTNSCPFQQFIRGNHYIHDGKIFVKPVGIQQSNITVSIKDTDCLIVIPPTRQSIQVGEIVEAILLKEE
jgi:molybdopterin molybdotransferase